MDARPVGTVHEGAGGGTFGDAVGLVEGVPVDGASVARGHIAVGVVEVTHPIGCGEGMGAGVILAIDVTAYIGFIGDVADGVVGVTLGHLDAQIVAQGGAGQPVEAVVDELLGEVLVEIVALFPVARQIEVIGKALDGIGPVSPGTDVLQVAVGRFVAPGRAIYGCPLLWLLWLLVRPRHAGTNKGGNTWVSPILENSEKRSR